MATYVPGIAVCRAKGTGGTNSGRYCYSVWLRHFVMAHRNGLCRTTPRTVVELGPGDSLGIGLAGLLTGAEKYYGFDVIEHSSVEQNLAVFDELVALFRREEDIPGEMEFPRVGPRLDSYHFPSDLISRDSLARLLDDGRISEIKASIVAMHKPDSKVSYVTGSLGGQQIPRESVDMVFSQAVLQYVEPLADTYRLMHSWLRPGGFISHQIDFTSHGLTERWDGHWAYSDLLWKIIRGKHVWFINRLPHSAHIEVLEQTGFRPVVDLKLRTKPEASEQGLARRFAGLSLEDRTTRGAFIQALKRN